ncbi:hypothetical protein B0H13DRAFT_1866126 [Mycena leptocephala]|nr:hypothetical protein B0H13DRAFT_1866126 [Mycena leptocephala]
MRNFNVRYECNDARDDFSAQDKRKRRALPSFGRNYQGDEDDTDDEQGEYGEDALLDHVIDDDLIGPKYAAREQLMKRIEDTVTASGWMRNMPTTDSVPTRFTPGVRLSGGQWKIKIAKEREDILEAKYRYAPNQVRKRKIAKDTGYVDDVTILDSYYFT